MNVKKKKAVTFGEYVEEEGKDSAEAVVSSGQERNSLVVRQNIVHTETLRVDTQLSILVPQAVTPVASSGAIKKPRWLLLPLTPAALSPSCTL